MELSQIIPHIEALIFASEKPLTTLDILELINNAFGFMDQKISLDQIEACVDGIREKYRTDFYSFEVRESGGGWQFLTKIDFHNTIAQLNADKFLKRLSNAALETLSIIAYKQPITKGEVEAIRGVNSDYSIQKLLEKDLIIISGRNEGLPGKPLIYSTSKSFMDYFGMNSAEDLPKIKEVSTEASIQATLMNNHPENENLTETESLSLPDIKEATPEPVTTLIVADNGELVEQAIEDASNVEISSKENSDEVNSSDEVKSLNEVDKAPGDTIENNNAADAANHSKEEE